MKFLKDANKESKVMQKKAVQLWNGGDALSVSHKTRGCIHMRFIHMRARARARIHMRWA